MEITDNENPIRENKPSGNNDDQKITHKSEDDAFKTPDRKNRMGWEQPGEEQQHEDADVPGPNDGSE